jgi:hypothetical protein
MTTKTPSQSDGDQPDQLGTGRPEVEIHNDAMNCQPTWVSQRSRRRPALEQIASFFAGSFLHDIEGVLQFIGASFQQLTGGFLCRTRVLFQVLTGNRRVLRLARS